MSIAGCSWFQSDWGKRPEEDEEREELEEQKVTTKGKATMADEARSCWRQPGNPCEARVPKRANYYFIVIVITGRRLMRQGKVTDIRKAVGIKRRTKSVPRLGIEP